MSWRNTKESLTYADEPIAHYVIDCETGRIYGPFETRDHAFDATMDFSFERWEIIDDSGNLQDESPKQRRIRREDKREAEIGKKRRNEATKALHLQALFRRCQRDPAFRAHFVAACKSLGGAN